MQSMARMKATKAIKRGMIAKKLGRMVAVVFAFLCTAGM